MGWGGTAVGVASSSPGGLSSFINPASSFAKEGLTKKQRVSRVMDPSGILGTGTGGFEGDGSGMNYWEELAMQYFPEEYTVDPYYTQSQEDLYGIGSGLTTGEMPDYYKAIGEYGGSELNNVIRSIQNDISSSVGADIATRNVGRGGIGTTANINAMNKIIPQLRYSDYERAMTGRGNLLNTGINTLEGVRQSGFNMGQAKSDFDLNRFSALLGGGFKQTEIDQSADAADASMWGSVAEGASGLLTKYFDSKNKSSSGTATKGAAGGTSISQSGNLSNAELMAIRNNNQAGYSIFG